MLTFGAAISTAPDHQQALDEAIPAALDQLGGAPDLVVCFFTSADKFKSRYATFGFNDSANLDKGTMWPTSFALTELTAADEA
ncbi:MAG TPA: hypothetical protein VFS70_14185, partial [Actinomycetota bacterium]|nr:hypothetical protein [Actinomycetota bacterium]